MTATAMAAAAGRGFVLCVLAGLAWVVYEVAQANADYAAAREADWDADQDFWDLGTDAMNAVQHPELDLEVGDAPRQPGDWFHSEAMEDIRAGVLAPDNELARRRRERGAEL